MGQLSAASAELDDELGKLFGRVIGAKEAKVEGGSFPVEDRMDGQTRRWTRQVSSNFGAYPASQADNPESISGRAFFRIGMARHGQTLLFSLDDQLLGKALDTLDKRYPPLAEVLPKDALVPATWRRSRSPNCCNGKPSTACRRTWSRYSAMPPTPT